MPLLTVPNWSIGRERTVLRQVFDFLEEAPVTVHYAEADIDHNRTVTAFSGTPENVKSTLFEVARLILPAVNLNRHQGVHPRIGGLDVCPFIPLPEPDDFSDINSFVNTVAEEFATEFEVPVFLYEKSARSGRTNSLPALRKGGFGGLQNRMLSPDYGPNQVHPYIGATVMGHRDFLLAMNMNFPTGEPNPTATAQVKAIAEMIRNKRNAGEANFAGVRALGFELTAQAIAQVSLNITDPDHIDLDQLIDFITDEAMSKGLGEGYPQLIGVIRDTDIERSVKVAAKQSQIVPTRIATDWISDWSLENESAI